MAEDVAGSSASAGIGVFVAFKAEPSPRLIVLEVMEGSPADRAGVRAHDSITGIDDQAIAADEGLGVVDRIRGPAGSTVRLRVRTPGGSSRLVTVERGQLDGKASLETAIVTGRDIGYLLFPAVGYDGLADDVVNGLSELTRNRRLEGLILDMRITGSAAGWPLPELLTVFTNGLVGEFYDREQGRPVRVEGQNILNSQAVPLVVLIGEHTAGLPEVFAASLQANRRAVLVGTRTPGLVESESAFVLPDGSRIFFESGSFRLLGGREIGQTGVEPDVLVEAAWDELIPDQDPLLAAALAVLARTDE
jgi:carboxyl-terminal processing protease